ncbi:CAP domain-containing protein [Streptomyces sp. NBC_01077]|uniref:CAP domain-containing protein n=1 Tax=Streptomyces sp. NBC_01077 TaxID=2903746 RepID=UPI0038701290|nr:CAP domain-containing protein [Streptomyces sp. NBC_01077]
MGRHRRAGAAPAAEDYADGTDHRHRGTRRKRRGAPVRTGLLGASAAVAVGAIAVASGLLPGGDTFTVGSVGTSERPSQSRQAPELTTQGGSTQTPTSDSGSGRTSTKASAGTDKGKGKGKGKAASPSATPSTKPTPKATPTPSKAPTKTPTKAPTTKPATPRTTAAPSTKAPAPKAEPKPDPTTEAPVEKTAAPSTADRGVAAEAEVVRLVNAERAKVGCSPVSADARLAALAGAFSSDMAARGFFDHTDPSGATPWARAEKAGISGLGGENIARGQADAAAVMESWMNSDGHRANILNCDFTTLGVGVHFAGGGPWWTQDFGY